MKEELWSHFGNWWAVAVWAALFGAFVLFVPFHKKADRKPASAFLAFALAFAFEMFGIPLSMYFALWAFGMKLPEGVLWGHTLIGSFGRAGHHLYLASILGGGALIVAGWARIYQDYWSKDEGEGTLVCTGLYRWIRHPQYAGFMLLATGALFEWATISLIILWPVLAVLYYRLARKEESEMEDRFGDEWRHYAARTGMFFPRF